MCPLRSLSYTAVIHLRGLARPSRTVMLWPCRSSLHVAVTIHSGSHPDTAPLSFFKYEPLTRIYASTATANTHHPQPNSVRLFPSDITKPSLHKHAAPPIPGLCKLTPQPLLFPIRPLHAQLVPFFDFELLPELTLLLMEGLDCRQVRRVGGVDYGEGLER